MDGPSEMQKWILYPQFPSTRKTRARHAQAKRGSFVSPRPNAQADRCKACALELKPRAEKKMADVLDVDVEDKGGFSEDEGDGKS